MPIWGLVWQYEGDNSSLSKVNSPSSRSRSLLGSLSVCSPLPASTFTALMILSSDNIYSVLVGVLEVLRSDIWDCVPYCKTALLRSHILYCLSFGYFNILITLTWILFLALNHSKGYWGGGLP